MLDRRTLLIGAGAACALKGCGSSVDAVAAPMAKSPTRSARLIAAARRQVGVTVHYDGGYSRIPFPNGDVPRERGVCTDVLIRAYRDAFGLDLQALVNADMRAAFRAYPRNWGLTAPDRNIDHRRVPNLATWLTRRRAALPIPSDPSGWQPGDIFTSRVGRGLPHIGLVTDRVGRRSRLVLHNIGAGAREEDALLQWPITGRFRWDVGRA
ncbi:DUF1287 domain-containing protein [Sphingosinicella sp. BN140058]|uniref:DUF1287 domain-containing protein n=1 Tax=Sphingosinicella sp. BN140058 TaxID=1892855 RepID=UPI001012123D|nr:DUF1287 domain-containing protein [Sphingosinicella sp. BN140058]QAY75105.1 DUF1287 domain-containing protein [Sphingosinicella sp. BN140058]